MTNLVTLPNGNSPRLSIVDRESLNAILKRLDDIIVTNNDNKLSHEQMMDIIKKIRILVENGQDDDSTLVYDDDSEYSTLPCDCEHDKHLTSKKKCNIKTVSQNKTT